VPVPHSSHLPVAAGAPRAATRSASTSTTTTGPRRSRRHAMLLTRKAGAAAAPQSRLARGLSGVLAKTMDRRTLLKRSGVTAGASAVAPQLPFNVIGEARAQSDGAKKVEVKRTVCTHCSVGCAIDAVVENGVWVRH